MTSDQFWSIVERVHNAAGGNMDRKCELLGAALRKLDLDEVRSFNDHFYERFDRAYSWDLWAAAYIIGGGCSDDGFMDFRSTLISMGRETYERALTDPQSLADMDYNAGDARYEGYQYVPAEIEKEFSDGQLFPRTRAHPDSPSGEPWDEDDLPDRFPKLARKYSFGVPRRKPWWKLWG